MEQEFLSCVSQCSIPLLEHFFSTQTLTPHLEYLQSAFNLRIAHPFFSVSSCYRLLKSTVPTFSSALLLRVVMDLHFPVLSLDRAEYFRRRKGDQACLEQLFSEWCSLVCTSTESNHSPPLEVESIDDSIQKVKNLELTLPPCAKTYLTISAEYLELGKMSRCFEYFRKFASSQQAEKAVLLQDSICSQLIHSVYLFV